MCLLMCSLAVAASPRRRFKSKWLEKFYAMAYHVKLEMDTKQMMVIPGDLFLYSFQFSSNRPSHYAVHYINDLLLTFVLFMLSFF